MGGIILNSTFLTGDAEKAEKSHPQKVLSSHLVNVGNFYSYHPLAELQAQENQLFFFLKKICFTCGCAGSLLLHWASLVAGSRDYPSLQGPGFSPWSTGSGRVGFSCGRGLSSCGARAQVLCTMWDPSQQGLDRCILLDRQILYHRATWKVPALYFYLSFRQMK